MKNKINILKNRDYSKIKSEFDCMVNDKRMMKKDDLYYFLELFL